jgi:hypothetical protein
MLSRKRPNFQVSIFANIEFEVRDRHHHKIGRILISRYGLMWKSKGKQYYNPKWLKWTDIARLTERKT